MNIVSDWSMCANLAKKTFKKLTIKVKQGARVWKVSSVWSGFLGTTYRCLFMGRDLSALPRNPTNIPAIYKPPKEAPFLQTPAMLCIDGGGNSRKFS